MRKVCQEWSARKRRAYPQKVVLFVHVIRAGYSQRS
jgi:hypothetical protein